MKEIALEVMPHELRMVLIENGIVEEVRYERDTAEHILNRIYKGTIKNILPGMEAAFVDIGIGQNVYLKLPKKEAQKKGERYFVGKHVLVQIVKEAANNKSPKVTLDISFAGQFVVLLPYSKGLRMSRLITDGETRRHLQDLCAPYVEKGYGFIIRTAAEKATLEELQQDIHYLEEAYSHVLKRFNLAKGGSEIYRDADFLLRLVRDFGKRGIDRIITDDKKMKVRLDELLRTSGAEYAGPEVVYYEESKPLFTILQVEEQLEALSRAIVPLASGGNLFINHTEAMTVIDVNSKSYTGKTDDFAETALAVNKEAAIEVCRQLRLRNIGGMVLIDFMDMPKGEHQEALLAVLRKEAKLDRTRVVVLGFTALGLVEMTRRREQGSYDELFNSTCSACGGTGMLLSPETIFLQIYRRLVHLERERRLKGDVSLTLHPEVASFFTSAMTQELEGLLHRSLQVEANNAVNRESYTLLSI